MKKFILSLAAVFAMVLTAASFTSCSSDDDNAPINYVNVKADFEPTVAQTATDAQKAQVSSILGVLNAQVNLLEGETFKMQATKVGSSYAPNAAAIQKVQKDLLDDDVVKTCLTQLKGTKVVSSTNFEIKDAKTSSTYYTSPVE